MALKDMSSVACIPHRSHGELCLRKPHRSKVFPMEGEIDWMEDNDHYYELLKAKLSQCRDYFVAGLLILTGFLCVNCLILKENSFYNCYYGYNEGSILKYGYCFITEMSSGMFSIICMINMMLYIVWIYFTSDIKPITLFVSGGLVGGMNVGTTIISLKGHWPGWILTWIIYTGLHTIPNICTAQSVHFLNKNKRWKLIFHLIMGLIIPFLMGATMTLVELLCVKSTF
ncbi:hypothetical protein SELMODRAFT_406143 [Selaginella moellendorffii]|uniref:Uncharacterized protein n=1 Tax=Selaginella moellendorffii TaxID=88036 RepID=D8R1E5_SELML|nr:hypothetical protein SELMODRAFT_406143 [Selaginella moellendorffii]